jgi:hypothetical protein
MARLTVSPLSISGGKHDADYIGKGYLVAEPEAGFTRTLLLVHSLSIAHTRKRAIAISL